MGISLKGFHDQFATFQAGEPCTVGKPVTIGTDGKVKDTVSGGFIGICAAREQDLALIQVTGCITLAADAGASPVAGFGKVEASTNGAVKAAATGREAIVVKVESGLAELVLL